MNIKIQARNHTTFAPISADRGNHSISSSASSARRPFAALLTLAMILAMVGLSSCVGLTNAGPNAKKGRGGGGTLSAAATSLSFGNVAVGSNKLQSVTITNTGTTARAPNQSVSVSVSFDPMTRGSLSGTLTVSSNAPALTITLGGTGMQSEQAANHSVGLTWTASASPVSGYFVYRRTGTSGTFSRLDSSVIASTNFTDSNVTDGATYFYVVTAVSAGDVESQFSTEVSVTIPGS